MRHRRAIRWMWPTALLAMATSISLAARGAGTGSEVIKAARVEAGLAVHVGTTDGVLEAELANGGRMLVQGLALSDEAAGEARTHPFGQKLCGLASGSKVEATKTLPSRCGRTPNIER